MFDLGDEFDGVSELSGEECGGVGGVGGVEGGGGIGEDGDVAGVDLDFLESGG